MPRSNLIRARELVEEIKELCQDDSIDVDAIEARCDELLENLSE
jgi:hypothetical protein